MQLHTCTPSYLIYQYLFSVKCTVIFIYHMYDNVSLTCVIHPAHHNYHQVKLFHTHTPPPPPPPPHLLVQARHTDRL